MRELEKIRKRRKRSYHTKSRSFSYLIRFLFGFIAGVVLVAFCDYMAWDYGQLALFIIAMTAGMVHRRQQTFK
jgi:hypothetical protein